MANDIETYYSVILDLTRKAAEVVRDRIYKMKQNVQQKAHATDFVTETDMYVEEMLITGLKDRFPTHKFIGEEGTSSGIKVEFTDDPTWIIDPVDGTLNFVHGYPNVCISVGLTINKELQLGVIQVPAFNWEFTAKKGCGAYLNGQPIRASSTKVLSEALITMETPSTFNNPKRAEAVKAQLAQFLGKVHGIRTAGSAAYNMCMVALGGCDAYCEIGIHAWDYAGGTLIVREAGGVVMDPAGGALDLMARRMLCAGTEELAKEMVPFIIQHYLERDDI